jgi:hypothetical protein
MELPPVGVERNESVLLMEVPKQLDRTLIVRFRP